jgi:hypothetical protein
MDYLDFMIDRSEEIAAFDLVSEELHQVKSHGASSRS